MGKRNKKYFIALSGAKKNVGDFLITDRAIALLQYFASEYDFIIRPSWRKLEDVEFVNNSKGIIILGGPAFHMNMYPGVYKLVDNLEALKVPIYVLGGGWSGKPGDEITEKLYQFTNSSRELLNKIENTYAGISCRDYPTERVLKNNDYNNITMTGCPAWYDLNSIGKPFSPPKTIRKIVFTPPQNILYYNQSIKVLQFIRKRYHTAETIVSFHRGLGKVDQYTSETDAQNTIKIADAAVKMGAKVVDVSYNVNKIKFYEECDLHIGYRVHAHIYFSSKRLPSILIHEDGRGNGVTETLNSPGINAYRVPKIVSSIFKLFNHNIYLSVLYSKIGMKLNENIIDDLARKIEEIESTNFECFANTSRYIDERFKVMESFIKRMVYGKEF